MLYSAIKEGFLKEVPYQLVLEKGWGLINGDGGGRKLLGCENKQNRTLVFGKLEELSKYSV